MISTATPLRTAVAISPVPISQPAKTATAIRITTGTKTPATRSASFWTGALDAWASSTSRTIWARAVSGPTLVAWISSRPCWLTVAPKTSSPACLSTGTDSPVSIDSSSDERPAVMTPSVGTFSPGSTTIVSPGRRSSGSTMTCSPLRMTRACLAPSSSSFTMACEARPLARASK